MTECVHQLVYISRATRPLDNEELDQLARTAAAFNARRDVTGLLLHDGMRFIQALEGARATLDGLMLRIAHDPRHDSIAYVERRDVTARQFGGWAMDARRVRDTGGARAFLTEVKQLLTHVDDHRVIAAFLGFAMLGRPELRARDGSFVDGKRPAA